MLRAKDLRLCPAFSPPGSEGTQHPPPGPFFYLLGPETGVFAVFTVTGKATSSSPKSIHHIPDQAHSLQISP